MITSKFLFKVIKNPSLSFTNLFKITSSSSFIRVIDNRFRFWISFSFFRVAY
nr:MAG TPA: hypothetical protein [Caudoviricetes sp.]